METDTDTNTTKSRNSLTVKPQSCKLSDESSNLSSGSNILKGLGESFNGRIPDLHSGDESSTLSLSTISRAANRSYYTQRFTVSQ
jgi:hypothetical protein